MCHIFFSWAIPNTLASRMNLWNRLLPTPTEWNIFNYIFFNCCKQTLFVILSKHGRYTQEIWLEDFQHGNRADRKWAKWTDLVNRVYTCINMDTYIAAGIRECWLTVRENERDVITSLHGAWSSSSIVSFSFSKLVIFWEGLWK